MSNDPDDLLLKQEVLESPILTLVVHLVVFWTSFIIGYSWKPVIASKNFDIFKNQETDPINRDCMNKWVYIMYLNFRCFRLPLSKRLG